MTSEELSSLVDFVLPYTMTDQIRIEGLAVETERILRDSIPGDIVECGVWKGGSMMVMALTLLRLGINDRDLYLFDTYSGMTPPEAVDVDCFGRHAIEAGSGPHTADVPLSEVRRAMGRTGYPLERIHYIVGKVEDTLPAQAPSTIALLHLDTDWYRSTKHELVHLFPRVSPGGCIMLDDYGHWTGARKATEEYLAAHAPSILPIRCGYTAVILRKPQAVLSEI